MKLICKKCKHTWETKTKLRMVTCPSCQLKVKIKEQEVKQNGKNNNGG